MSTQKGRFVWYELMTTNPVAAMAFYTKAIGWTTEKSPNVEMDYTLWKTPRGPVGGVMELPEEARKMGAPPHWNAYIGTPDIAATVKQATELGAKVYVPVTDVSKVGKFAILADPQGAVFGLLQGENPGPEIDSRALGEISWHELYSTDPAAGLAFYTTLFGWEKKEAMDMGPMGTYQIFGKGDKQYGGMMRKPAELAQAPSHWNIYATVDSIEHAAARIRELGGKIVNGPMEVPGGGKIINAFDPQGAAFSCFANK